MCQTTAISESHQTALTKGLTAESSHQGQYQPVLVPAVMRHLLHIQALSLLPQTACMSLSKAPNKQHQTSTPNPNLSHLPVVPLEPARTKNIPRISDLQRSDFEPKPCAQATLGSLHGPLKARGT